MKKLLTLLLAMLLLAGCAGNKPGTFEAGKNTFLLNGKPFIVKAAEVHYPRIPREYWEHRIEMCKALGMNTLCLYVFWNLHEETPGNYDFTGNKDIAAFVSWRRSMVCMSSSAPVRMCVPNGKWAVFLVVVEERQCGVAHSRSVLYGTCRYVYA